MYKLFVFALILSVAAAHPGILAPAVIASPAIVKVAVPTAISHSSISQIHAPVPIVAAHVPVIATPIAHAPILVHG